ncbi:MAG: tetratricopeptide repeat protein [Chlamydiae bacterium]|nr:tetratricopeptide repeat protein [Chlamydiota bacterium]MBI3266548.1 tetratricopeptide repeat protein [Chlamydiota bacterium]
MKRNFSSLIFFVAFLAILAALVYLAIEIRHSNQEPIRITFDFGQPQKNRIAVLFFHNLSGNPEDEYLSDGLTEDVITKLAKIDGLNVVSMTDVMRFKNGSVTIREVGKALNVDAVVEGSIRKMGETLLVTAQLIDVATGLHIWAERYERKIALQDIFGLQNELAAKIADAAHLTLTQAAKETLVAKPTLSSGAYEFYLRGKFYDLQMTTEGNWMAIEMFQKAVEMDAHFALAYASLGDAYAHHYHMVEPEDPFWLEQASTQINKALELDPNLAQAHKAMGHCYEHRHDLERAAQEYQKSLALKPDYVEAQIALAQVEGRLGHYEEALRQLNETLQHHPELPYIDYAMAGVHALKGDKDDAFKWLNQAVGKGFYPLDLMKRDAFLNSLRRDARWKPLLKLIEKKTEKEGE